MAPDASAISFSPWRFGVGQALVNHVSRARTPLSRRDLPLECEALSAWNLGLDQPRIPCQEATRIFRAPRWPDRRMKRTARSSAVVVSCNTPSGLTRTSIL